MSESEESEEIDLAVLAKRLVVEGMPVQKVIASEAGVSQPTVSRAIRGQIKQPSRNARKLWAYAAARMAILREQREAGAGPATPEGTDPAEPTASAGGVGRQHAGRTKPRIRARPIPRRRSEADGVPTSAAAMAGLRDYLADAFDPQLVIEQLAVLRRAQDPARRRGTSETTSADQD
jgi:hypothetical protein